MSVETEAASGPQDNAGSGSKSDALDKALNAAFAGQPNDGSDDFPPQKLQEAKDRQNAKNAGDDTRGSEDARAAGKKAEAAPAEATPAEGVPELREAPKHWPEERRKAFAAWAKEVQDHALAVDKDLQAGFTRKSQELSDQAKFAESVRGLFGDHHRQQLSQAGLDEVGAIRYFMQLQDFATRDAPGYARWFIQQSGLTPDQLGFSTPRQPSQQQHQQPQVASTGDPKLDALLEDPGVAQLRQQFGQFSQAALAEIQALKAERAREHQARQEYAYRQQVEGVNSLKKQWGDFRSAQDDHGQLAHPHADALMQPMGALMETHPLLRGMPDGPEKLAKAYQMALAADPDLSKPIIEAEISKRMAEQQKKAEAERAKKAAAVKPATGAPTVPAKKGGLDAALNGAFASSGWKD